MESNSDLNWAREHVPKGCYSLSRWNLGCDGRVEWFDANDEEMPYKRSSPIKNL
jgi:hypothetical protein